MAVRQTPAPVADMGNALGIQQALLLVLQRVYGPAARQFRTDLQREQL